MRRGFSLVEALVALALFQIAMLALAATTAVAARDLASATRRTRATAIAANGVQFMRVTACSDADAATQTSEQNGYTEFRRIALTGGRRVVSDSVVYALPAGRHAQVTMRGWLLCG
jgi:Tfp pilus assembly protein PilV